MHKEYAVDPEVIASSWETCRHLVDLFGFHQGRLISEFPKKWRIMAFDAATKLSDGRKKQKVVEYIRKIGREFRILIDTNRVYTDDERAWIDNVLISHNTDPFAGIITSENKYKHDYIICEEDCSAQHPLMKVKREDLVLRTPEKMAEAAAFLLKNSAIIRFIDSYFDPSLPKWRNPLKAFLEILPMPASAICEYHYLETDNPPDPVVRYSNLPRLSLAIPNGMTLKIFRWREFESGEDFHPRYVLTEKGGLRFEAGLEERSENEHTDVTILDADLHETRWNMFNLDSTTYSLQDPVYIVDSHGNITEQPLTDD